MHVFPQVEIGSLQVVLAPPSMSLSDFFPQGQYVTSEGERGHGGGLVDGG